MKHLPVVSVTAAAILAVGLVFGLNSPLRAQAAEWQMVPPESVPASGTFWLFSQDSPPLPFFPPQFADLDIPVYSLDVAGSYLIDERFFDYSQAGTAALASSDTMSPAGADEASGASDSGVGAGCGLWLSISTNNDTSVLLTLHNTRTGQTYTVWSTEDISITITNWSVETNVTGASGDLTETIIAMGQRTNLFLRASEYRDYVTNTVFQGLSFTNTRAIIADTMGAVGPSHFVELLNGLGTNTAIAVYDKSGTLISQASMSNFFSVVDAGTNYPTGNMSDPRILYDHQSQRWVATAIQQGPNIAILAVSNDDSPTNLVSGWTKYLIRVGKQDGQPDYDTLGLDANGIYLSVLQLHGTNDGHTIVAIKKPEIYQGTNFITRIEVTNDLVSWTIQPAVNFDDVATNGYAWFVAKGPPDAATNYQGAPILYRRLQWAGTNADWADTNWFEVSNSGPTYQDYYELAGTNFASFLSSGVSAPQAGGTNGITSTESAAD